MTHGEDLNRRPRAMRAGAGQGGFAYLWILFFIAFMGVSLAATGVVWEVRVRRDKEADLLSIGAEFRRAIADYYRLTPQAAKELPKRLEDLVEDRRGLVTRRHLRRIYRDPLTGSTEWGLTQVGGRISGVYSLAAGVPIRQGGFAAADAHFEGARRYADWRFVADGVALLQVPAATPSTFGAVPVVGNPQGVAGTAAPGNPQATPAANPVPPTTALPGRG